MNQDLNLTQMNQDGEDLSIYNKVEIPVRWIPIYDAAIPDSPYGEPTGANIEYFIDGKWLEPVSKEYKDKAERYEKLATSTQVLLNLSMNEIKTLNEKIEQLEEKIWELTKENLSKY